MTSTSPEAIVGPPSALIAIVAALVAFLIAPWWIAAAVGLAIGVVLFIVVRRTAPSIALDELGARPMPGSDRHRVVNLIDGLCLTGGLHPPRVHLSELSAPDAAIVGRSSDNADMIITRGAIDTLSRLELEALVARTLCLLDRRIETSTLLCAAGRLLGRGPLARRYVNRYLSSESVVLADFAGVRLTRYPPALASAMVLAEDAGGVPSMATTDHLWMFGPTGNGGGSRPPLDQRIDTLQEL